jgi:hypothetical protein
MAVKSAVFLSFPQDPQPARMSAQATGTQAEFKRDCNLPGATHAPRPEIVGLLT